jgi:hypothetical protein
MIRLGDFFRIFFERAGVEVHKSGQPSSFSPVNTFICWVLLRVNPNLRALVVPYSGCLGYEFADGDKHTIPDMAGLTQGWDA